MPILSDRETEIRIQPEPAGKKPIIEVMSKESFGDGKEREKRDEASYEAGTKCEIFTKLINRHVRLLRSNATTRRAGWRKL